MCASTARLPHDVVLSYCTNMHPGDTWEVIFENLKNYIPTIKREHSPHEAFGFGLRLSQVAAQTLLMPQHIQAFKTWLIQEDCFVFTLNGFVYGGFYHHEMKHEVYQPYWHEPKRVDYTLDLIKILVLLSETAQERGISISPLGYKFDQAENHELIKQQGAKHLVELVLALVEIEQQTGVYIHLDIEPEPDCLIETIDEFIAFYQDYLLKIGLETMVAHTGCTIEQATSLIKQHITLCLDVCHFAVNFESVDDALLKLSQQQLKIGKVQLSSALSVDITDDNRDEVITQLEAFVEPIYLHQTRLKTHRNVRSYTDLDIALADIRQNKYTGTLRSHYHVPVFIEHYGALGSTQGVLSECLTHLREKTFSNHLEIETYTWAILPETMRLTPSLAVLRELQWVHSYLTH